MTTDTTQLPADEHAEAIYHLRMTAAQLENAASIVTALDATKYATQARHIRASIAALAALASVEGEPASTDAAKRLSGHQAAKLVEACESGYLKTYFELIRATELAFCVHNGLPLDGVKPAQADAAQGGRELSDITKVFRHECERLADELASARTRMLNMELDLNRLLNDEETLCGFEGIEALRNKLAAASPEPAAASQEQAQQPMVRGQTLFDYLTETIEPFTQQAQQPCQYGSQEMQAEIVAHATAQQPIAQAETARADDGASDPLQGAANWLCEAIHECEASDIAGRLSIGYNRAKRLHDAALSSSKGGANG